jgi:hypothetical protein
VEVWESTTIREAPTLRAVRTADDAIASLRG